MRNYWLDVVMALLALTVALSALLLWVVFPQGYFAARLLWLEIHKWTGLALSLAVLLHILLHWSWLVRMTKRILESLSPPDRADIQGHPRDPEWTSGVG
jgi:hypothetical protein